MCQIIAEGLCNYTYLIGLSILMCQIITVGLCNYTCMCLIGLGLSLLVCQIIAVELLYMNLYIPDRFIFFIGVPNYNSGTV